MVHVAQTVFPVAKLQKKFGYKFTLSSDRRTVMIEKGGAAAGSYPVLLDKSKTTTRHFINNVPLPQGSGEPIARRVEVTLPPEWFHS